MKEVENLLREGADVNVKNDKGETPLHFAAEMGHAEIVKDLLDKGANVNAVDKDGKTPFKLAANEEIQTLLENTAKLLEAAKSGNVDAVTRLISTGASVNATDQDGKTPLHLAARDNNKEIVEALLKVNGINVNATDQGGKTPLHLAARDNNKEIVEALLKVNGINVNAQDKDDSTPLHWAAVKGHEEVVEALLGKDGIDVNIEDKHGNTPFKLATDEGIKTLLQNAEKTDPVDESSTDSKGDQEEDAGTQQKEKLEGNIQPGSEKGTDVQDNDVGPVASTEPAQTEEQPSSFFGSLFSILMKPFSLIASFFGGFFSWLFGSDEEKSDTQPYDDSSSPEVDQSVEQNNGDHNDQSNVI
ncbi:ankyrin repeat domain-containing protein [Wolbachia endosymbiont (group A) of Oxytorus armatus]|uniref:ankyrin repeat domain-containing protein n=1 Tax=Wolbachia endosymbiont (group A) of Oxytorus armatus TaxID=3066211 RepID=UPI00313348DA